MELRFQDWIWSPFVEWYFLVPAFAVLVWLLIALVAGLWRIRIPGELSDYERKRALAKRGSLWPRIFLLLIPLLVWLGTAWLLFPVTEPQILLLSSRARQTSTQTEVEWERNWDQHILSLPLDRSYLDVGPLVDAIIEELLKRDLGTSGWQRDDAHQMEQVTAVIREQFRAWSFVPLSTPEVVIHRKEGRIPRWLCESIEIAVVKLLTQTRNVSEIALLGEERVTELGSAWEQAPRYWQRNAPRIQPPVIHAEFARQTEPVQLERVYSQEPKSPITSGTGSFRCLFSTSSAPTSGGTFPTVQIRMELIGKSGQQNVPFQILLEPPLEVTLGPNPQMHLMTVAFTNLPPEAKPQELRQFQILADGSRREISARSIPQDSTDQLADWEPRELTLKVNDEAVWDQSFAVLHEDPPGSGWMVLEWQQRMQEFGYFPNDISRRVQIVPALSENSIVIDDGLTPGSIWIYPARLENVDDVVTKYLDATPVTVPADTPYRGALRDGFPTLYSLDDVPLLPQTVFVPRRSESFEMRMDGQQLSKVLREGQNRGSLHPLVTRFVHSLSKADHTGTQQVTVLTHIAIDPQLQKVFLKPGTVPPAGSDFARTLGFWSTIYESLFLAAAGEPPWEQDAATTAQPLFLVQSSDLRAMKASSVATHAIPLLTGICLYAFFLAWSIRQAPASQSRK